MERACEVSVTKIVPVKKELRDTQQKGNRVTVLSKLTQHSYETYEDLRNRNQSVSSTSEQQCPNLKEHCGWCEKRIEENVLVSEEATFCSESCFSQSRRASFKKNKTCDWCKTTQHAVTYVDFQDGNSQLHFCSDKCLNQYKMQIFCKEAREHLEHHPHLREDKSSDATLITPDLWLQSRHCGESSKDLHPFPKHSLTPPLSSQNCKAMPSKRNTNKIEKSKKTRPSSTITTLNIPNVVFKSISDDSPQDLRVKHISETEINDAASNLKNVKQLEMDSVLPPATMFVPYPFILPLPLPIPIPIPIPIKETAENIEKKNISVQTDRQTKMDSTNNYYHTNCLSKEATSKRQLRRRKKLREPKAKISTKKRKLISTVPN